MTVKIKVTLVEFKWTCPVCGNETKESCYDYIDNTNCDELDLFCDVCETEHMASEVE